VTTYITRRLLTGLFIMWLVTTLIFGVTQILPGDAATAILGDRPNEEVEARLREELGLNDPIIVQYLSFFRRVFVEGFGRSLVTKRPILQDIGQRLPYSMVLTASGALIGLVLGIPAALLAAYKKSSLVDQAIRIISLTLVSFPAVLLGVLLILGFSITLHWFPMRGGGEFTSLQSILHHLFLPAMTIGVLVGTFILRAGYPALLEVLSQEYVTTAHSKGLSPIRVSISHVLRNALIPLVTLAGLFMNVMLGGAIMIEVIFVRPGIGTYIVSSLTGRDFPALQASLLLISGFVVLVNLIVDIGYALLDPRIRFG